MSGCDLCSTNNVNTQKINGFNICAKCHFKVNNSANPSTKENKMKSATRKLRNAAATTKENIVNNSSIVIRTALFIASLGVIGLIVWKLPIVEMLYWFAYSVLPVILFLVACGVVSVETVKTVWAGSKYFRTQVEKAMAEQQVQS